MRSLISGNSILGSFPRWAMRIGFSIIFPLLTPSAFLRMNSKQTKRRGGKLFMKFFNKDHNQKVVWNKPVRSCSRSKGPTFPSFKLPYARYQVAYKGRKLIKYILISAYKKVGSNSIQPL